MLDCNKSQMYGLVVVTGPATEPVTMEQLRAHLRLAEDSPDLSIIESTWLPAAREAIEKSTDLRLISQTVRMTLDRFPLPLMFTFGNGFLPAVSYFELPLQPVSAVSSIKYLDLEGVERTLDAAAYTVDASRKVARVCLNPGYSWPAVKFVPAAVRVEFVVGWEDVDALPASLRAAVMLQTEAMFEGTAGDKLDETVERLVGINLSGGLDAKT